MNSTKIARDENPAQIVPETSHFVYKTRRHNLEIEKVDELQRLPCLN